MSDVAPHKFGFSDYLPGSPFSMGTTSPKSAGLLDGLDHGVVLADKDRRVVVINRMALEIATSGRGLTVLGGLLELQDIGSASTLEQSIGRCTSSIDNDARSDAIRVHRAGRRPLMVLISRYDDCSKAAVAELPRPLALVKIADLSIRRPLVEQHLSEWFGLTRAEAALASALANGERLEGIAKRKCVQLSTLRTQLSAILAKVGVERQADLLGLLSRLPTNG